MCSKLFNALLINYAANFRIRLQLLWNPIMPSAVIALRFRSFAEKECKISSTYFIILYNK